MKRILRNKFILKLILIIGLAFYVFMFADMMVNHDVVSYDELGNQCNGKYVKVCGGKING